jgi:hypothetical protein
VVDADVALEAGVGVEGTEVRSREKTLLRPGYFLVGLKSASQLVSSRWSARARTAE